ncbi:MAG TPA: P-loop NTPase fold protein [Terracidiphilus sp.]
MAAYPFNLAPQERAAFSHKVLGLLGLDAKRTDDASEVSTKKIPETGTQRKTESSKGSFISDQISRMSAANAAFASIFFLAAYAYWIRKHAGKSLELKLEKYLTRPDYQARASFVETFHEDFRRVVRAYAGKRKVFIFVDDLDRTDVPKAAELMQAINLMIGEDDHLVFILGIDREKVAAGIALKFKDIQPFLDRTKESEVSARHPAAFGYLYLEKFIQVTFRVPRPSESGIQEFLDSLANRQEQMKAQAERKQAEQEKRRMQRRFVDVRSRADSDEVQTLIRMVAPALQWNPRRMKQFINDFRLQAYIASDLGLLDFVSSADGPERAAITLEQLGKFVAITMAWPDLVMDLIAFPALLRAIHKAEHMGVNEFLKQDEFDSTANGKEYLNDDRKWLIARWSKERLLLDLLLARGQGEDGPRYSLENTDLRVLLNISPKVQRASAEVSAAAATPAASQSRPSGRRSRAESEDFGAAEEELVETNQTSSDKASRPSREAERPRRSAKASQSKPA